MSPSLDSIRQKFGPEPRRMGFFNWRDKIFPIPKELRGLQPSDEPLLDTLLRQKEIWRHGKIVWGHVIVANRCLKLPGDQDLPGEVVYSLTASDAEALEKLPLIAEALAEAKFAEQLTEAFAPEEQDIIEHLRLETDRAFGLAVPASFAEGLACFTSTFWGHRDHLPEGALGGRLVPLLVLARKVHDVLIIPGKFWPQELTAPWSTTIGERKVHQKISQDRIAATLHWNETQKSTPPPLPWKEATPEALAGTWVWECETILHHGEDGTIGSQWVTSEWRLDIEQRCWLRLAIRLLIQGEMPEDAPNFEKEYAGTYLLENGTLTCTLPEHEESPLRLTATAAGELVNEHRACFLPITSTPKVAGVSEGGSTVYLHQPRAQSWVPPDLSQSNLAAVDAHIEEHLGQVDFVWHELVSDLVHIDIHVIKPTPQRNWYTLVTSGMSDRPMHSPEGAEDYRYAEVMMCLPPTWKLGQEHFKDEQNYWPIRWLKMLARLPHEYNTWLSYWHTVPNGDPAEPLANNTSLVGIMLVPPMTTHPEFGELLVPPTHTIRFLAVIPLTADEMAFKLSAGASELFDRLERANVTELLNPARKSVLK
jgi:Suppressor of fused protein (SUFU)